MKLHLGCGRTLLEDWVNVDQSFPWGSNLRPEGSPTFVRYNLDSDKNMPWPTDSVDQVYGSHVIEHLQNPLAMMEQLWRVCKPGAIAVFECPYGSSDDADEDPTHVRRVFPASFQYFGQPYYWRADYGYKGDWQVQVVELEVPGQLLQAVGEKGVITRITHGRNFVLQQRAYLECIKPKRAPDRDLQIPTTISLLPVRADGWTSDDGVDRLPAPDLGSDQLATEGDSSSDYEHQSPPNLVTVDLSEDEDAVYSRKEAEDAGDESGGL